MGNLQCAYAIASSHVKYRLIDSQTRGYQMYTHLKQFPHIRASLGSLLRTAPPGLPLLMLTSNGSIEGRKPQLCLRINSFSQGLHVAQHQFSRFAAGAARVCR